MNYRELACLFNLLEAPTGPFGERGRQMVLTCLETPTVETWEDVQAFVLVREPLINFADAVYAVDPTFQTPVPVRGPDGRRDYIWQRPPSRETMIEALKYAAFRWR